MDLCEIRLNSHVKAVVENFRKNLVKAWDVFDLFIDKTILLIQNPHVTFRRNGLSDIHGRSLENMVTIRKYLEFRCLCF